MYREGVRCPFCSADDDRVVDSRLAEDGVAIDGGASAPTVASVIRPLSASKRSVSTW